MSAPFYVSPEQWYRDKAEYARKGIARGKPIVAIEYAQGIVIVGENPSSSLRKISEIYDHIAFAGVGKFDEYENLRKAGIRFADLRGYSYCRDDVAASNLANEYSTVLGSIFTREMKPFEVEILVVEVSEDDSSLFQVLYDGSLTDHKNYASIGGDPDELRKVLDRGWREQLSLEDALKLGCKALASANDDVSVLNETNLEVAVLDRTREGRRFQRLDRDRLKELLNG
jgi:proteasome alpha subunit